MVCVAGEREGGKGRLGLRLSCAQRLGCPPDFPSFPTDGRAFPAHPGPAPFGPLPHRSPLGPGLRAWVRPISASVFSSVEWIPHTDSQAPAGPTSLASHGRPGADLMPMCQTHGGGAGGPGGGSPPATFYLFIKDETLMYRDAGGADRSRGL